ncbi:SHOCT domain-containing protein [Haloechinothrix sp. LS1_15]|uniref:SHOCT domain-containing protein n=1 Tax=Haloechinothrix sp. LS1_15 TaxID=2652248 RepID=UPI0029457C72|nr:SHOCT domain-containing protein [Haloechinothrix sp. LS1_15]MDV6014216.1 SHOCT domain-containing protein [Haloechinothrix sp. LS1_15]
MFWHTGAGGWEYAMMITTMVLFWGLVIVAIVALVRFAARASRQDAPAQPQYPAPEQLLAERYARGEIGDDEYRRQLDTLRATRH